jgi:hypothetical protein
MTMRFESAIEKQRSAAPVVNDGAPEFLIASDPTDLTRCSVTFFFKKLSSVLSEIRESTNPFSLR